MLYLESEKELKDEKALQQAMTPPSHTQLESEKELKGHGLLLFLSFLVFCWFSRIRKGIES